MKQYYVRDLKSNMEIIDFFMVRSISVRIGTNKKQYLDLRLSDKTGEVNGKKWDVVEAEMPALSAIKEGDIIKVKAQVSEWQGAPQLRILKIRPASAQDGLVAGDFIKAAPEPSEEMHAYLVAAAESMRDEDFRRIALKLLTDNKQRLLYYPAAAKNHHAEYGGLLWHMKRMLMAGRSLCRVYDLLDEDLVMTGVIIHDMEKLNEIDADENGAASGYSTRGQLLGHIVQGVTMIDELCKELGVPEEKALVLEHMVLSHHYEPDFGSPKKPMFPEAEVLHYLDILDARMYDMEEALIGLQPGNFSERVRTLDGRKVYRPSFAPEILPADEA
ncbi:MAG: HD domain-containing protein [Firmicutes bacterium]|nr:HD domain-containing protein [Bacillota bacterium]MCR4711215.1 HD domain-containing protein [Clostridia bacterium]